MDYLRDPRFFPLDGWVAFVPSCLRVCDVLLCVSLCVSVPLWFSWRSWCLGGELSAFEVAGGGENELLRVEVAADGI